MFYVAARERSHTKAARLLFITQPAVTQNVKSLETYLGLPLFRKAGRNQELTPAGEALYAYAERIFAIADDAERAMHDLGAIDRGELRVGTTKIYARYLMPSIIDTYRERHPNITVILEEGSSEQMVQSVEQRVNHVAVAGAGDRSHRLSVQHFRRVELALVAGPGHPWASRSDASRPLDWSRLADMPLILREAGSSSRRAVLERLARERVTPRVAMESGSLDLIKRYVAEGKGVAFLFEPDIRAELEEGRLVRIPLAGGELQLETYVFVHPEAQRTPAVRAFLQVLEESATAGWSVLPHTAQAG